MKAVLFDLDGTLLDRNASLIEFVRWQAQGMLKTEILNVEQFVKRFIELDANGYVWKDKVYESLISEFSIQNWSVEELLTSYELCFCAFAKPMEGAVEAVKTLSSMGAKIALVSNGKTPFQERNFNALGISSLFDTIVVSEAVGLRKPEKAIFELACELLETDVSNAIFVGDSPNADIEGANNAGMYSVYIPSLRKPSCEKADIVCKDFKELPNIVSAVNNA
jgi:putative hydrolase of the HAD superfamily